MHRILALLVGITLLVSATAAWAKGGEKKRVLVVTYTAGFYHSVIPTSEKVLQKLADDSGFFTVDFCRTKEDVKNITRSRA